VRQSQLTLLDDFGTPVSDAASPTPSASTATTPDDGGKSRSRLSRCVKICLLISCSVTCVCCIAGFRFNILFQSIDQSSSS
jgi:hypothetical protein